MKNLEPPSLVFLEILVRLSLVLDSLRKVVNDIQEYLAEPERHNFSVAEMTGALQ